MGRVIIAVIVSALMSGCVIMSTVSGVAGAAADGLFYMFQGAEESFPMSMRSSLVAVQRGLGKSGFHVNVLEPDDNGYLIAFGNDHLDGKISMKRHTESLTAISIKVKNGAFRQDSIERALIASIQEQGKLIKASNRFNFKGYKDIFESSDAASKHVGWYLPGTLIEVHEVKKSEWMRIKLPSGKIAFLKGNLVAAENKGDG